MKATLRQIASAAHVSISTASRALNGHPAIHDTTVANVREAAERLCYQRRRCHGRLDARRSLARARIGVVSLGMDRSLVALPVVAAAIAGAEAGLADAGATVQLTHVPNPEEPPRGLRAKHLSGLILMGAMQGELIGQIHNELTEQLYGLPLVWIVGRPKGCSGDAVTSDDYATGSMAAEYLIARGHRRLAFLNPKPDHSLFLRREDGFVATARRLDVEVRSLSSCDPSAWRLPLHPPETVEAVQNLVDQMLAAKPRPTAVFAAADSVAALVYRACSVRNLRVGRDISIISGNNDAALIAALHPRLTTFDIHAYEIGQLAVRQLAMRMAYPGPQRESELMIQSTLLEGESVANLSRGSKSN